VSESTKPSDGAKTLRKANVCAPDSFGVEVNFFGKELTEILVGISPAAISQANSEVLDSAGIITAFQARGYNLCLPKQVHGAAVVNALFEGLRPEADAVIVERSALLKKSDSPTKIIGIITADCAPVVLCTKNKIALIHAGWRGLAARILSLAANALGEKITHCAIGPNATGSYEVGEEVIAAIGTTAVFTHAEKTMLDLTKTALKELAPFLGTAEIWSSKICTMADTGFYSYRREGKNAGRNLTVVSGVSLRDGGAPAAL